MSSMIIEHSKEHPNTVINITRGLFVIKEIPCKKKKKKNEWTNQRFIEFFTKKIKILPPPVLHILTIPIQNIGTISNSVTPIRGK